LPPGIRRVLAESKLSPAPADRFLAVLRASLAHRVVPLVWALFGTTNLKILAPRAFSQEHRIQSPAFFYEKGES
jgi:hypothetical protein